MLHRIVLQIWPESPLVLHSHVLADGTQKIVLRITQQRKHKYVGIGYWVKADDWNKEKKEIRKSHRLWHEIRVVMKKNSWRDSRPV